MADENNVSPDTFTDVLNEPVTWIAFGFTALVLVCSLVYLFYDENRTEKENSESKTKESEEKKDEESPVEEIDNSDVATETPADNLDLDDKDIEMIKKVKELDTSNPQEINTYVKDLRSRSYRNSPGNLTETEKEQEESVRREQLAGIYALMSKEKEKFGDTSLNDIQEQMTRYTSK